MSTKNAIEKTLEALRQKERRQKEAHQSTIEQIKALEATLKTL